MKSIPVLIIFFIIFSSFAIADAQIETKEGTNDLQITINIPDTIEPSFLNPEIFLCEDNCKQVEIKSISYSENEIDFFVIPEESGNFDLNVFLTADNERISYKKKITIYGQYEKTEPEKKEKMGVTGNIIKNTINPFFGLGLFVLILIVGILKLGKRFYIKNKLLDLSKRRIEVSAVFLLSFLVLSAVTHEFFHIVIAGLFSCPVVLEAFIPVYTPASVSFFNCEINSVQSIMILGAGITGNLVLGILFYFLSLKKNNLFFSTFSLAFVSSSFFYLFYTTGDIHNIMKIIGLSIPQMYMDLAGVSFILTSFYLFFRRHLEQWHKIQVP